MNRNVVGVLAAMLALTAGCTSTADTGGRGAAPADTGYPKSQAWALNDGVVTDEEYRTAVAQAIACARAARLTVGEPQVSPVDNLTLLYDIETSGDPDAWSRTVDGCNEAHLSIIEPRYIEKRTQVMAPELRTAVDRCLRGHGVATSGTESNMAQFVAATKNTGEVAAQCVNQSLPVVFPKAPKTLKMRW